MAEIGHPYYRLGGRTIAFTCPVQHAASNERPDLSSAGEGGRVGAPVVYGDAGGRLLASVAGRVVSAFALGRLTDQTAETASELGEAELKRRGHASLTPGRVWRRVGLPDWARSNVGPYHTKQDDRSESKAQAIEYARANLQELAMLGSGLQLDPQNV
jgi:hypothetical protein